MGLFDFRKKKDAAQSAGNKNTQPLGRPASFAANKGQRREIANMPDVIAEEKQYYQDASYYTESAHPGTIFERKVITFEERKKISIPSRKGLYVAEILLLSYCDKGQYPHPKDGYPGFWWFEYGIRDVGAALKSLESRGFIVLKTLNASVSALNVPVLKEILERHGKSTAGKKADLVERVKAVASDSELQAVGLERKYTLTVLGRQELEENAYVPFMHSYPYKTTEDGEMNVWAINKKLGHGDKTNWRAVVEAVGVKTDLEIKQRNDQFLKDLAKIDPKGAATLKAQDEQIALINQRHTQYQEDKDLESYITFWEELMKRGGLLFHGVKWDFMLPDLYIKAKRYDDALACVEALRKNETYTDKADKYIQKITERKNKVKG